LVEIVFAETAILQDLDGKRGVERDRGGGAQDGKITFGSMGDAMMMLRRKRTDASMGLLRGRKEEECFLESGISGLNNGFSLVGSMRLCGG
jgi:hypothetical protein